MEFIYSTQINIKVSTSWNYHFLGEVVRHIKSAQNRKLVMFLQYEKKVSQLLSCFIAMQNIQIFYGGPVMFSITCYIIFHDTTLKS